jgi:hypothetical protein
LALRCLADRVERCRAECVDDTNVARHDTSRAGSGGIVGLGVGLLEDIDEDNKLSEVDRAFLTKWLATADDPIWSGILDTGQSPDIFPHYTFPYPVRFALRINRRAESGRFGGDLAVEARQKRRGRMLDLADKVAELARFLREQAKISRRRGEYETELRPLPELVAVNDDSPGFCSNQRVLNLSRRLRRHDRIEEKAGQACANGASS